jgi:hypothetical protein
MSASSGAVGAAGRFRDPKSDAGGPRLPLYVRLVSVVALLMGLWGAFSGLTEVNTLLLADRDSYVVRVRDRQLGIYDQLQQSNQAAQDSGRAYALLRPLIGPFLKLPRTEIGRLSAMLGDSLYEWRSVSIPLGLLQVLLSWVLLTGAVGTLRGRIPSVGTLSWGCMVNIPFSLLSVVVTFVHSRRLMSALGNEAANALAKVSGHPVEQELQELWQVARMYVISRAAVEGTWVLALGLTALLVQRYVVRED